ncbi:hypothetical protein PCYB_007290 [Plasmodium cynomolgi strain B]|uniref:CYIR protein n=1 Tax=Plasmodium cynomolgi (strain B) TaxID=1120755 RepID=K6V3P7_PLACD|nr:hypothetical protein PCYB_007290 [Plasmodium cynomolgi strain B]GAB69980.1 hypothetical protein PCYB_007290 [Plasmodium cynomolgi strain B]
MLRTKYIYDKLDRGRYNCEYYKFYEESKNILERNKVLKDDSDKILRGLCYVYSNSLSGTLESNMRYIIKKKKKNIFFQDVISELFNALKKDERKICLVLPYYFDQNNFENVKLFFDYSEDYYTYKKQITYNNMPCNKNYMEYLKKYVDTYKKFQGKCLNKQSPYTYCDVFNECFAEKNSNLLSKWTCNLEDKKPEARELYGETKHLKTTFTNSWNGGTKCNIKWRN